MMRRLNLFLLASLRLCGARSDGFSIHSDLLAFPQYEVIFAEDPISEKDAELLLENRDAHPTYSADFTQPTGADDDGASASSGGEQYPRIYELMNMSQNKYLCSIPVIQPSAPQNETANELAKAAEAREHSRATAHGWNLLSELEDTCLYFGSGWWTYSFCHNREIVQYHALPAPPSADKPPKRDPRTAAFTLGREPAIPAQQKQRASVDGGDGKAAKPLPAELQITGDQQRYLVQKLEGGDVCDLTGRERTIEVQYQCKPGLPHDKIGYIKEVTICAYLMVIYTPRLCNDVAFLPREEPRANPINCQLVVENVNGAKPALLDAAIPLKEDLRTEAEGATEGEETDATAKQQEPINIGGILVGARNVLSAGDEAGKPPTKLNPPSSYFPAAKKGKPKISEVVARGASKEDGGKVEVLSKAEIEKLGLSSEVIEEMREQLEKLSGGKGWKLEVVQEEGGEKELRGWIYGLEGEEDGENNEEKWWDKDQYEDEVPADGGGGDGQQDGSEEKFKDEL
ncbi:hypothetical protein NLU13_5282 [Sarocladium strictum]|uniref:Endoplasmic reticulum lectin n=1 Tax=Sarocladium strictum TaxID=5046 RepID=A0AA39GHB8_SARSR|nr:hypothetical protein NLU13_5282 [Sarocladium strictum]